eukprot:c4031_g1_i1.p1 GENE.c4031_g1_i1~~c4031_g1_i1.p1  ORF type:complete len:323 (-),score=46.85 c4031_g1_i1:318-1286(-)
MDFKFGSSNRTLPSVEELLNEPQRGAPPTPMPRRPPSTTKLSQRTSLRDDVDPASEDEIESPTKLRAKRMADDEQKLQTIRSLVLSSSGFAKRKSPEAEGAPLTPSLPSATPLFTQSPNPSIATLNHSRLNISNCSIDTEFSSPGMYSTREPMHSPAPWSPQSIDSLQLSSQLPKSTRMHSRLANSVCVSPDNSPEHFNRRAQSSDHCPNDPRHSPALASRISSLALASSSPSRPTSKPHGSPASLNDRIQVVAEENNRLHQVGQKLAIKLERAQAQLQQAKIALARLEAEKQFVTTDYQSLRDYVAAITLENASLTTKLSK